MTSDTCSTCGTSAEGCQTVTDTFGLVSYSPIPRHCCTSCSGDHSADTYQKYYPTKKEIA